MFSREAMIALLDRISDPVRPGSVVKSGRATGLVAKVDGQAGLVMEVGDMDRAAAMALEQQIRRELEAAGATSVRIIQTSERTAPPAASAVPGVSHIVAVGAGKGGVGKSTVAVNLALALRRQGLVVGLLDADIQGPSAQILLGISGRATATPEKKLRPVVAHGLPVLGMGLMADPDKALAWRGPMVAGAVVQMATSAEWGQLDVLVVDLPPGTGDIHLALAQKLSPSGAIVVTTPQELARADARRAVAFYEQLQVPVLGIVQNMAGMIAPDGSIMHPFGPPATESELGARLLVTLPLDPAVAASSDRGQPATGPVSDGLDQLAAQVIQELGLKAG